MIITIIIAAIVIVLGSKAIKGIFNIVGKALKITVKVALAAVVGFAMISAFCKENPEDAKTISTFAQSSKLRKEAAKAIAPAFEKALKAEYESFSGESVDDSKSNIKKVIDEGKANAKACEEELYGSSDIVLDEEYDGETLYGEPTELEEF